MSTTKTSYLTNDNYNLLFKIIRDDIQQRFQIDIAKRRECRSELQDTMKSMYSENPDSNIVELNKKTILTVAPSFYQLIQRQQEKKNSIPEGTKMNSQQTYKKASDESNIIDREREVFSRKLPEFVDLRPHHDLKKETNSDTLKNFQQLNNQRNDQINPKRETPDFSRDTLEQELTPQEMLNKISSLQNQRDLDNQKVFPDSKYKESDTPEFKKFQKQLSEFENSQNDMNRQNNQQLVEKIESNQQVQSELLNNSREYKQPKQPAKQPESSLPIREFERILPDNLPDKSTEKALFERGLVDREIKINQIPDTKQYQQSQQEFTDNLEKQLKDREEKHIHTHDPGDHIQQTINQTREVDYTLEVSSMDRDISVDFDLGTTTSGTITKYPHSSLQHRYHFQVSLGTTSDGWKRMPLYENSPTIPATTEQAERGERGFNNGDANGWRWGETGEQFAKYDSSKGPGNIVGYEMIREVSAPGARVDRNFQNVSKIELLQVVLPSEFIWDATGAATTFQNDLLQYPFLLVHIEEIDGVYLSTSKNTNTAFGKIVFDKDWSSERGRWKNSFVRFSPSNKEAVKRFVPAPLASLNKLTISFLNPLGQRLNYDTDIAKIKNIIFGDPTSGISSDGNVNGINRFLKINLGSGATGASDSIQYVNRQIFNTTRKILFRDYQTVLDPGESRSPQLQAFEKFINREEGHTIITTEASGGASCLVNQMIDTIYIQSKGSVSSTTGLWVSEWDSGETTDLTSLLEDNETSGYVYHMNHQSHLTFRITQLEEDVSNIPVRTI